ncbi:diagnostic antigen gp50 [Echinococcus multilocularis]|uniref:Diagnostic antigen gp50 n=1 Tax=Echinococcus multilocularis TaxID=6211 RepID=A0A068XT93_ECHMU|nr:diagnostic antigen gp50 [Echinococcus multilocularis]
MLKIIAVVLCVAYCTGERSPELWGSRVVGTPSGPSNTMSYFFHNQLAILVSNKESEGELTIEDGQCMVNGTIWGSPCTEGNHAANITVKDVSSQNRLDIFTTRDFTTPFSTTVFAPYCEFPKPDKDEVDVQTSFPLSRFVKGQKSFELAFAIGGADSNGMAHFVVDGERACEWRGHKLVENNTDLCTDLEANRTSDLRVFRVILPTTSDKPFASFIWGYYTSYLTVTVDFTQSGTSPEVAECSSKFAVVRLIPKSPSCHQWHSIASKAFHATENGCVSQVLQRCLSCFVHIVF